MRPLVKQRRERSVRGAAAQALVLEAGRTSDARSDHPLRDLHGVEGGALQQLVAADEEVEAVVAEDQALADAADVDVVAALAVIGMG
jgi:hypothetical protein